MEKTTIQMSVKGKKHLDSLKQGNESYESVINRYVPPATEENVKTFKVPPAMVLDFEFDESFHEEIGTGTSLKISWADLENSKTGDKFSINMIGDMEGICNYVEEANILYKDSKRVIIEKISTDRLHADNPIIKTEIYNFEF